MRRTICLGLAAAAIGGVAPDAPAATAAAEEPSSLIVFTAPVYYGSGQQDLDIFGVRPDGSGVVNLSKTPYVVESQPVLSPDGTAIAYRGESDRSHDIWIMDADGLNARPVTTTPAHEGYPAWSPDGTKIAYAGPGGQLWGSRSIWTIEIDGSNATRITQGDAQDGNLGLSWSSRDVIAFHRGNPFNSDSSDDSDIWTVNADGTDAAPFVHTSAHEVEPRWSPDGSALAYTSHASGRSDIWVYDGETHTNLTSSQSLDWMGARTASWSPDGTSLAYAGSANQTLSIRTMTSEGTDHVLVISGRQYQQIDWGTYGLNRADLVLRTNGVNQSVVAGETTTITATVKNLAPLQDASGVTLTVEFSDRLTFEDAQPSAGTCTYGDDGLTCDVGTVERGSPESVRIDVVPVTAGVTSLVANVTQDADDPDTENNLSRAGITVTRNTTIVPGEACSVVGTPGVDELSGTWRNDVICGLAGSDYLMGFGGNDRILAGSGIDEVLGGRGNDEVLGEDDSDLRLVGGPGADGIFGGEGDDALRGRDRVSGNDSLDGGNGTDTCTADSGDSQTNCP